MGRSRIVSEWANDRPVESLDLVGRGRSFVPGVVYVVHADDQAVRWESLLRPLEEGRLTLAVTATDLPAPVLSRLPVFRVGLLSDFEVSRVLQLVNKMLQPRQLIAKLLGGSLARLDLAISASRLFESLDQVLVNGTLDELWRIQDYRAALWCFQAACSAAVADTDSPFKKEGLDRIPWPQALAALDLEPHRMSEHQARNSLLRLLRAGVCRG